MIVILPASLLGQDSSRAILHADGGVWLNGNPAANSTTIFPYDVVQTQPVNTATINAEGSTATVQPNTVVQFEGDELVLDHGSLEVNTSRAMKVRVNCMTVVPLTTGWTRYEVTDADGKMQVAAGQNDVKIQYSATVTRHSKQAALSDVTVHQGEQVTREDKCGTTAKPGDVVDARAAILNSTWAKGAGAVAIGVITCYALCRGGNPVSPSMP